MKRLIETGLGGLLLVCARAGAGETDCWKPYSPPCIERENVFEFIEKPSVKLVARDRYAITFTAKSHCDVTVSIVDPSKGPVPGRGTVVRHLASGVLGSNAPEPFQKDSLKQTVYWNGKDDLDEYVESPERLRVRVSLGLKPEFEKRLGGTSPHNVPGKVWGLAATPDGVCVVSMGRYGRLYFRMFDHEGRYLRSLVPPPANLPEAKLNGMAYIEYEPGRKALQARRAYSTVADAGFYVTMRAGIAEDCQVAIVGDKVYFCDRGVTTDPVGTAIYNVHTDGSTDSLGTEGRVVTWPWKGGTSYPRLAASPDGKWLYLAAGVVTPSMPLILRAEAGGTGPAEPFLGNFRSTAKGGAVATPGSDDKSFQNATGIDCDGQGRIYVADQDNNRVQVFSPDGKYLKTIPVDRPHLVQVHRKTGGIYVLHMARVEGKTTGRLTKFRSFDDPAEACHVDGVTAAVCALDSWSAKPRLWTGGGIQRSSMTGGVSNYGGIDWRGVEVYEDDGTAFHKVMDFDEVAREADGNSYLRRWRGSRYDILECDPTRNKLYYGYYKYDGPCFVVDLETGEYEGNMVLPGPQVDDIAFDKKGYMHIHFNPGFYIQGVGRWNPDHRIARSDPGRSESEFGERPSPNYFTYPEVPYDYGVPPDKVELQGEAKIPGYNAPSAERLRTLWLGILPVKDQPGCKFFQDGLGVNMRGDVAEESNIYFVPKMDEMSTAAALQGDFEAPWQEGTFGAGHEIKEVRGRAIKLMEEMNRKAEDVYFIKRAPGIPLSGGTIWTFDSTGRLRDACAVIAGDVVNGAQIDEDGKLYFANARIRTVDDKGTPFLVGKGGLFGEEKADFNVRNPLIGTLMKSRGKNTRILLANAPIPLDPLPARPPDLIATDWAGETYLTNKNAWAWAEGMEWMYAGASPISFRGCSCPALRIHTDWYKRTFVPEQYRHSIGVVDTNGNLILHIGQYGNLDSGDGPKSRVPVGGDGIAMSMVRFISGTDDRLVFDDHSERIVCLRLDYHAEEAVDIPGR